MLYQEDVIRAAMAVAGVDATAGDGLRRHLGKRANGRAGTEFDTFLVAGLKRGLPRPAIEQVWAEMARFAAYSFCKAHAVTYGRLAFRCVFLKARWPAAFLAAVLQNDAGYFAPGVYAEDSKRLGATLQPPCVNTGGADYELVAPTAIRVGLAVVRGLGERTVQAILTARAAGGPFRSLPDFLARVRPSRDEVENLILAGALDAIGPTRPELLWRLQVATTRQGQVAAQRTAVAARGALFADAHQPREVVYPTLPEFDEVRRTDAELRTLGFTLGSHPVDVLWRRGELPVLRDCMPCGALEQHVGESVSVCGFAVAFRPHHSEQGSMCFVTLEDGTGIVEATLFHRVFQQCGGVLQGRGPFVLRGTVEERLGGVGLHVVSVELAGKA